MSDIETDLMEGGSQERQPEERQPEKRQSEEPPSLPQERQGASTGEQAVNHENSGEGEQLLQERLSQERQPQEQQAEYQPLEPQDQRPDARDQSVQESAPQEQASQERPAQEPKPKRRPGRPKKDQTRAPAEKAPAPAGVRRSTRRATVTGAAHILPLLLLSMCTAAMTQKMDDVCVERSGVYFQQMSQISFSESHWTIVSDFSLDRLSDALDRVQKWIKDRETKGVGSDNLGLSTRI